MRTFYIMGTKKKCNEDINTGQPITVVEYKLGNTETLDLCAVKEDCVIKFWTRRDPSNNPIAKSYGIWRHKQMKVE